MPIDASIPLSTQPPKIMGPQDVLSLQSLSQQNQLGAMQVEEQRKTQENKNALRTLMQDPSNIDPSTGMLNKEGMGKVTQIDPQFGFKLSEMNQQAMAAKGAQALQRLQITEKQNSILSETMTGLYAGYKNNSTKVPSQQANQMFMEEMGKTLDGLEKSGNFSPQQLEPFRKIQGPGGALSLIAGTKAYKDYATETRQESEPKSAQGKIEADFKAGRIDQKTRDAAIAKADAPPKYVIDAGNKGNFEGRNGEILAALAEKGVSLPAGFRSKEQQLGLLNSLSKRNPDLTPDQIADKIKGGQIDLSNEKTWGRVAAGIGGKVAYAENEIKQTIPLVRESSAKLPRGEFIPYNKLVQMGQDKFSNPDLAEFRMYMTSLSNAYDMLAARGGTDMEKRKENRKNFETAQSPEALERIMQAVLKEAEASGRAATQSLRPGGSKESDSGKKATGPKAYDDAEKERRYQEWKKQQ